MTPAAALLLAYLPLLGAERLVELALSRRNVRWALARGGVEAGRGHHPAAVALHAGLLAGCAAEPLLAPRAWPLGVALAALAAALAAQALRWWAVATLGRRWSTRIVVLPGAPRIARGPYRLLRHPNYLAVTVELAAVPLIGGAVVTAAVATLAGAAFLAVRIPAEERALAAGAAAPVGAAGGGAGGGGR